MASNKDNVLINTDKRLFYLSDNIDNVVIGQMAFNLLFLLRQDDAKEAKEKDFKREPIQIYINSFGGEVYDMWALIDIILNSKTPIYTYCTGYAMSAGCNIFLAGHKRFISKHSTLLYHQVSCWRHGKYQDLVEDRAEMDWMQDTMEEYVLSRTKMSKEDVQKIRDKKIDFYIHANDAVRLGFADEIIEIGGEQYEK